MASGVQPFRAPDTRRLEQRIRSLRPAPPLDAASVGFQAIVAKLLAGTPADRYGEARSIREDLERLLAGQPTHAQAEGWPGRGQDEPGTRRTRTGSVEAEATRRTTAAPPPPRPTQVVGAMTGRQGPDPRRMRAPRRFGFRVGRAALLIMGLAIVGNEMSLASRAERIKAAVPMVELEDVGELWDRYDALRARGLKLGVVGLERALTDQTAVLADRVIGNYRSPTPTVREAQWRMAHDALTRAVTVDPDDRGLRGRLRYCDGHLHRINGEARKARKQIPEAQQEFTDAVTAFREAAELRPNWPDPFLGLMRTFIYGLEDVDRGTDALKQAQKFGYTAGDRETAQLADGYRARGDALARAARTVSGTPQEQESLARAADAYRQALDLYGKAVGFADVARNIRAVQRGLKQVEQRMADLSQASVQDISAHVCVPAEGFARWA
jgi:tetratricopeptide (TPR) repeat protein